MRGLAEQAIPLQPQVWSPRVRSWDVTRSPAPAELLQKAFQLAYFLIPDRETAIAILTTALEKLRVRSQRETKRLYWRDKHPQHPVRKITRCDMDMLQWLIMFESETYERSKESQGTQSQRDLSIWYVKHLVQLTTALSSFYVNVALGRLLYNYTTSDAQAGYEILTGRFLGADEYRRAKAAIMERVATRFDPFLRLRRVHHGEHRFDPADDQAKSVSLVNQTLSLLTPWSTLGQCSDFWSATEQSQNGNAGPIDFNLAEVRASHIFIEPECYRRLSRELTIDLPDTKLSLPRFFMPDKEDTHSMSGPETRHAPGLTTQECDQIQRHLAAWEGEQRRQQPIALTIVIDGEEQGSLDLMAAHALSVEVKFGARLVELRGRGASGVGTETVFATHFINYAKESFDLSRATAHLSQGTVIFDLTPIPQEEGSPTRASLNIGFRPTLALGNGLFNRLLPRPLRPAVGYLITAIAMLMLGWGVADHFYQREIETLKQDLARAQNTSQQSSRSTIAYYRLADDSKRSRGGSQSQIPKISLSSGSTVIVLEMPLAANEEASSVAAELQTFDGDRTLMKQMATPGFRTPKGRVIRLLVPSDQFDSDSYYTVVLTTSQSEHRFSFEIMRR